MTLPSKFDVSPNISIGSFNKVGVDIIPLRIHFNSLIDIDNDLGGGVSAKHGQREEPQARRQKHEFDHTKA